MSAKLRKSHSSVVFFSFVPCGSVGFCVGFWALWRVEKRENHFGYVAICARVTKRWMTGKKIARHTICSPLCRWRFWWIVRMKEKKCSFFYVIAFAAKFFPSLQCCTTRPTMNNNWSDEFRDLSCFCGNDVRWHSRSRYRALWIYAHSCHPIHALGGRQPAFCRLLFQLGECGTQLMLCANKPLFNKSKLNWTLAFFLLQMWNIITFVM